MDNKIDTNILLSSAFYVDKKEFWSKKLHDEACVTLMPMLYKNGKNKGIGTSMVDIEIAGENRTALLESTSGSDLSLYVIFVSCLKILMYRYLGKREVSIVSPLYTEAVSEFTLAQYVVLYDTIDFGECANSLFLKVGNLIIECYENQDYPVQEIVDKFNKDGKIGFRVSDFSCRMVNIHGDFDEGIEGGIHFVFGMHKDILTGKIYFNSNEYDDEIMGRMSAHFSNIIKEVFHDKNKLIDNVEIMDETERNMVLYGFNSRTRRFPEDKTYIDMFEEQVAKSPDAIALEYEGRIISYNELHLASEDIARRLSDIHFKRSRLVAILLDRSDLMVKSILAIWKLGDAYVPLDYHYPIQRIIGILSDAAIGLVITHSKLSIYTELLEQFRGSVICIDEMAVLPRGRHSYKLSTDSLAGDQLAYVIFTSGSTGRPKGAMIQHKGMLNHMLAKIDDLEIGKDSVVAQNASHMFDISVWQFFCSFISGGKTIIYPDGLLHSPSSFLRNINQDKVTILEVVPAYLLLMLKGIDEDILLSDLRYLMVTGEALYKSHVKTWMKYFPKVQIVNAYGPTEASDDVCHFFLEEGFDQESIPIGKPLQNLNIYVLNDGLKLCPIGIPGEICISGIGVGLGYLNNVELTNEVFVTDPFTTRENVKMYKTGDFGKWTTEGTLEFLGRKDLQIKINGRRIELEEIEIRLLQYECIHQAVVVAFNDEEHNKLIAYYLSEYEVGQSGLREYMIAYLPSYMIPSYFIRLDAFPLTDNGKINRRLLSEKALPKKNSDKSGFPRNEREKLLVDIWGKVLKKKEVGIYDKFFEMGGDSIKAIQVSSSLYSLNYKLDVKDILINETISEQAALIRPINGTIDQSPVTGPVPLTPIQRDFFSHTDVDRHHYNMSVMIEINPGMDELGIRKIFAYLVNHHDALRMQYSISNEEVRQFNLDIVQDIPLRVYNLQNSDTEEKDILDFSSVIQSSNDLENGSLVNIGLFRMRGFDLLLVSIHHLVIDGVSWRILLEDINRLFIQYQTRVPFQLPLKTDSFKKWAELAYDYAWNEDLEKERPFWSGINQVDSLKRDLERPDVKNTIGETRALNFILDKMDSGFLAKVNQAYGTQTGDLLLTALGCAINRCMAVRFLLIELEGHGREEMFENVNIGRTVGWFTSSFPVLLDMSCVNDISLQIKEIKETINRVPNKGIGFGLLKHIKGVDFNLFPQVGFNYLGQFEQQMDSEQLKLSTANFGNVESLNRPRQLEFNVSAIVVGMKLHVTFAFSGEYYKVETVQALISEFEISLQRIFDHCSSKGKREFTPSDYDYKNLSLKDLDSIFE